MVEMADIPVESLVPEPLRMAAAMAWTCREWKEGGC